MVPKQLAPSSPKPYRWSTMYFGNQSIPEFQIIQDLPTVEDKPAEKPRERKQRKPSPVMTAWKIAFVMAASAVLLAWLASGRA